jgi:hypothetical protein
VKAGGFADDTTAYLAHPNEAQHLRRALNEFATASGLQINVDKCQAVALASTGWSPDVGDIGFRVCRRTRWRGRWDHKWPAT